MLVYIFTYVQKWLITIDNEDIHVSLVVSREKLDYELEITSSTGDDSKPLLTRTRAVADGLLERLNLLLHVTIMPEAGNVHVTRSRSTIHDMQNTGASKLHPSPYYRNHALALIFFEGDLNLVIAIDVSYFLCSLGDGAQRYRRTEGFCTVTSQPLDESRSRHY